MEIRQQERQAMEQIARQFTDEQLPKAVRLFQGLWLDGTGSFEAVQVLAAEMQRRGLQFDDLLDS